MKKFISGSYGELYVFGWSATNKWEKQQELEGHRGDVLAIDTNDIYMVSADQNGILILWKWEDRC